MALKHFKRHRNRAIYLAGQVMQATEPQRIIIYFFLCDDLAREGLLLDLAVPRRGQ